MILTTRASKVEFLKGLHTNKYSIKDIGKDIGKDNFDIFKNSEDEYTVMNCRTKNIEVMNSSHLKDWQKTNRGEGAQIISYTL